MVATFLGDSELANLMREHDWAATPLGPVESWPGALRAAVRIVLTSRFAMWMAWGDELTFFYNDAYARDTLGAKHPWALGRRADEVWREIWPEIGPRITSVLAGGPATWDEGLMLILERSGYSEETYHTFSYSPLHDDAGAVRGMLCVVTEETGRVISERRVALLGRLAFEMMTASSDAAVLAALERALAPDARDLPFTLSYLYDEAGQARLAASTGFGALAPPAVCPWPLDARGEQPVPAGAWPTGPWAQPPSRVVLVPLAQQGRDRPAGVLVAALQPHRVFDAGYRELLTLLAGQVAAGLANARAYDHERRRAESLAELDRAKTQFFSNVSHEFRTPLTLMLGPLHSLLDDPALAVEQRTELETIERNGQRLLKLVNTMLDFSRLEAGRTQVHLAPVDVARVTSDLASVFRAAIEKAGLRFVVDCPPLDVPALVDLDLWEKVVLNLLSNALKFTFAGEIAVSVARRGDAVAMTVRDTGTGIPAEELPHLFERFHRVEGARGRTHEGTGIGLALVQELVHLHGGTVAVASELGRGTAFTVELPIAAGAITAVTAQPRAAAAFTGEAMRWLPDAPVTPAVETGERRRVLVADDNADMREYLRRLLGTRWAVETVANGHDALEAMAAHRPDLVLSDVMMPVLDGFGLLAAVRADPALRELPVVLLSARAGEEARIEGLEAGATDYIVKPFAARELLARVEALLIAAAVRAAEQAERRRLAEILEQAPVPIAIFSGPTHVFEITNARYRKVIGDRHVIGIPIATAFPAVAEQGFVAILDRVFASGEPWAGSSVPVRRLPTDEERLFDLIYQPLRDAAGRVTGIAAISHDVTALAMARSEAESANRAKDEFLAMLGHELRNPLAPILTALELLRLRGTSGREHDVIDRQVQHLVGLVDDLLDVSRITRGKVELRRERVGIATVIAHSVEVASPLFERLDHTLVVDAPPDLVVLGDPTRLAQVVSNLLTNAAKYTPRGGRIAVSARRAGDAIEIVVRDNGIGIEPAMLERVFEPFAQARQAIDRAQGGLGLGLAIVANLTKLHGGTVTARSDGRGKGTEMIVRLPADASAPAVAVPAPEPLVEAGAARILVVDDNVDAAQLLADLLEIGGYRTLAAHDGPSALKAAETFQPQIAVLDIGLPVMDGFELAGHFRTAFAGTRLVAVTGYGQAEDRKRTAAAGFVAHLVKPVDIKKLRATIEQLLAPE